MAMLGATTEGEPDRGQVGIETLIIFIAMILVAAVAAGVLINTAGFLQNKASTTSEDSESQVSNQVIVISATGNVNASGPNEDYDNTVNTTELSVMKSPGADEIDLSKATIEWVGPDGTTTLIYNDSGDNEAWLNSTDGVEFGVSAIKDDGNSVPVLTSKEDRFTISINHTGSEGIDDSHPDTPNSTVLQPLEGGEEVTLRLVTQAGSSYVYIANVPESLSAKNSGEAVEL